MPRVVHFEIPAENPERAVEFYREVFGWEIKKWEGPMDYWLVMTGEKTEPGIDGGLMKMQPPATTTINTVEVSSLDDFLKKVKDGGGEMVTPKQAIPGVGYHCYCKDTEGNLFGLMQSDPNAK